MAETVVVDNNATSTESLSNAMNNTTINDNNNTTTTETDSTATPIDTESLAKTTAAFNQAKDTGNMHFSKGDFSIAIKFYNECVKLLPNNPIGYSNRAACELKLYLYNEAESDCTIGLQYDDNIDSNNNTVKSIINPLTVGVTVKLLFRRATARYKLNLLTAAINDCELGLVLDNNNISIKPLLKQLKQVYSEEQRALESKKVKINRTADFDKQAQSPYPIPTTAIEFDTVYRKLNKDLYGLSLYIQSIPPTELPTILSIVAANSDDLFNNLLNLISQYYIVQASKETKSTTSHSLTNKTAINKYDLIYNILFNLPLLTKFNEILTEKSKDKSIVLQLMDIFQFLIKSANFKFLNFKVQLVKDLGKLYNIRL